jgi:uncharacterized protein YbgA (DUF1722 family)
MSLDPDFAEIIADLVFALEFFSPELNNQEKQQMEDHLSSYIRNYFLEGTSTVLIHYVARYLDFTKYNICNNLEPIKLMIKLGTDPNAIDEKVVTPLQILARKHFFLFG